MVIENLLGFSDAYMTLADNYYIYSNPKASGQMVYISADLDTTIGISLFQLNLMLSGNYTEHPGFTFQPLTKKLFSSDVFSTLYQEMLLNMTQNLVNPTIMNPFIDSVVNMIRPDVQWDGMLSKLGQLNIPTALNNTEATNESKDEMFSKLPPGLLTDWFSTGPQTFDSAVTGPSNSTTMESVKGFIAKKSEAILAYYNVSS